MSLMIPDDSFLRNPPSTFEPRERVGLDGLRYAFDLLGLAYDRLLQDLAHLTESRRSSPPDAERVSSAFLNIWTVCDGIDRLRRILKRAPGLKRSPELEVQLRAFGTVEELRHGFQHLEERFSQVVEDELPLWGSISWLWSPEDAYTERTTALTLVSGGLRSGYNAILNPLGKSYSVPIGLVTLTAFRQSVDVSDLMRRVRQIAAGLETGLREAAGQAPRVGADILIAVEMRFGPGEATDRQDSVEGAV